MPPKAWSLSEYVSAFVSEPRAKPSGPAPLGLAGAVLDCISRDTGNGLRCEF